MVYNCHYVGGGQPSMHPLFRASKTHQLKASFMMHLKPWNPISSLGSTVAQPLRPCFPVLFFTLTFGKERYKQKGMGFIYLHGPFSAGSPVYFLWRKLAFLLVSSAGGLFACVCFQFLSSTVYNLCYRVFCKLSWIHICCDRLGDNI